LSGLAFFHPAFYPLTQLFGGGVWARILHPIIGALMMIAFVLMFFRFKALNKMSRRTRNGCRGLAR
jgi:formate dehydrogenase subunit gamma